LIDDVRNNLKNNNHMIIHAPTGLGKTVAALVPALEFALKKDITIFFLTSRHTQHMIAIETLKAIKEKHNIDFSVVDIIGKKWLCPVEGADKLFSNEFSEYCKSQREEGLCEFYNNTRQKTKMTVMAKKIIDDLYLLGPLNVENSVKIIGNEKLCPYEVLMSIAEKAKVIICDYYHLFHPGVRETFLGKNKKTIENSIIIIDEAHNLPSRARELLTNNLSNFILKRAINEAKEEKNKEIEDCLKAIFNLINEWGFKITDERLVARDEFINLVQEITGKDVNELVSELDLLSENVRDKKKQSYCGLVSSFLEAWQGPDEGFVRILHKKRSRFKDDMITLSYRCLDPSLITKSIIENSLFTIVMSGTLTPTNMYRDVLGFPSNTVEKVYPSPFDEKNKLNLIIPDATTKFTKRNDFEYEKISAILANVCNSVPGNTAVFFPSYFVRDAVCKSFVPKCNKTTFTESSNLTKDEKSELLDKFKSYSKVGSVLLAVCSGSFGEGIDLPGDFLKCVIVVGLPLSKPDLETNALINYYDRKFRKGWDYGYLFPGINKTLQSAGRCIRTETDKGVIVFVDERYTLPNYYRCFPKDWDIKITKLYVDRINEFFKKG
jgi:DNA excision repair protein ERCC-2